MNSSLPQYRVTVESFLKGGATAIVMPFVFWICGDLCLDVAQQLPAVFSVLQQAVDGALQIFARALREASGWSAVLRPWVLGMMLGGLIGNVLWGLSRPKGQDLMPSVFPEHEHALRSFLQRVAAGLQRAAAKVADVAQQEEDKSAS